MTPTKVRITQVRSSAHATAKQRGSIRALGLGRPGHSRVHDDKPEIRGMIAAVAHLVEVEENHADETA